MPRFVARSCYSKKWREQAMEARLARLCWFGTSNLVVGVICTFRCASGDIQYIGTGWREKVGEVRLIRTRSISSYSNKCGSDFDLAASAHQPIDVFDCFYIVHSYVRTC
jgi:hypothetical protein